MKTATQRLKKLWFLAAPSLVLWLLAAPSSAAKKDYQEISVSYDGSATPCITVSPDPATIYWNQKPKKVKFVSGNGAAYYWRFDWKPADEANYFGGSFDIKCGQDYRKSKQPTGRKAAGAKWVYSVAVYACDGNLPTELLCEIDPVIDWGD